MMIKTESKKYQHLKQSASIWLFISKDLFNDPIMIQQNYDIIPETFQCVIECLYNISLINSQ